MLGNLTCSFNQLAALNVSANPALAELWCSRNQLMSLDVSMNPGLGAPDLFLQSAHPPECQERQQYQYSGILRP